MTNRNMPPYDISILGSMNFDVNIRVMWSKFSSVFDKYHFVHFLNIIFEYI